MIKIKKFFFFYLTSVVSEEITYHRAILWTQRQIYGETDSERDRGRERDRQTDRDRDTERENQSKKERQTDRLI